MIAHSYDTETTSVRAHLQAWEYSCVCKSSLWQIFAPSNVQVSHFRFYIWVKIKLNTNYLHAHIQKMYNICKLSAVSVLFQLLLSACAHCHFKSVASSTVAPADDIFQAYFQQNGCWMPAALFSTDLLHYCRIQHLLAALLCTATDWQGSKAHWKFVSLSKLPEVSLRGNNQDISFSSISLVSCLNPCLFLLHQPLSLQTFYWYVGVFFFFRRTVGVNFSG